MKKIFIIIALIIMFATSNMSIAQADGTTGKTIEKQTKDNSQDTIGNTADTLGGLGKFSLQLEGNWIFKREMTLEKANTSGVKYSFVNPPGTYTGGTPSNFSEEFYINLPFDMESQRVFLNATLGLHRKVDVFIKLGAANANLNYTGELEDLEFDGDLGFAWGAGVKIKLFEGTGGFRIMTRANYISYKTDSKFILEGEDFSQAVDPGDSRPYSSKIKAKEWGIDLYVNKSFKLISPYLGISYSDSEIKNELDYNYYYTDGSLAESGKTTYEFGQDNHIGVFLGANFEVVPQVFYINLEGRFINETATTIEISYKF